MDLLFSNPSAPCQLLRSSVPVSEHAASAQRELCVRLSFLSTVNPVQVQLLRFASLALLTTGLLLHPAVLVARDSPARSFQVGFSYLFAKLQARKASAGKS